MTPTNGKGGPVYDADARCPKCGHDDIGTGYREDSHDLRCSSHSVPQEYDSSDPLACSHCGDEHFHRTCRRCQFAWREEVIVAGQPTRADLIASYEMKVADLAAETLRAGAWRDACRWAAAALSPGDKQNILDGEKWAPPEVMPLLVDALEAGRSEPTASGREVQP